MSAESIFRVTLALQVNLQKALTDSGHPGTVFIGPLDDPDAQGAALILFLYRMAPNAVLRNSEHRVAAPPGQPGPIVYTNALPLDLYYLITVGTRPGSSEEPLLSALGAAIQALNDLPQLAGSGVAPDPVRLTMETLSTEEISRIWALFPTVNYRTSIAYLASPVWIDPATPPQRERAVTDDSPRVGQHRGTNNG